MKKKSHFKKLDRLDFLLGIIEKQSIEISALTKTIDKLINIHFYCNSKSVMYKQAKCKSCI